MDVTFDCKCGEGKTLAHAIRQFLISTTESWKPIAFLFPGGSSIMLHDSVVQSAVMFSTMLNTLKFDCDTDGEFFSMDYTFSQKLYSDDLNKNGIICEPRGIDLLQSLSDETISFKLFFRKATGTLSNDENYAFLQEHLGEERLSFPVVRTNHYTISKVSYDVVNYDTHDTVIFHLGDDIPGVAVIQDTINRLVESLQSLSITM